MVIEPKAGSSTSPVLLHVPHAGRAIPADVRDRLLLDDVELAAELAALTDHDTDGLARTAADRVVATGGVRPHLLINPWSRFVIDPERLPDEREEMAAVGMGAVYTHGTRGQRIRADDPQHRAALLAEYFTPWADAVRAAVEDRLAATGTAVLLDVHSYPRDPLPYERHADGPRPPVCLGTDPVHTPEDLVAAAMAAFAPVGEVGLNSPFAGTYVPLAHLGRDRRVVSIMLELRRDALAADPVAMATALADLIDAMTR